MKFMLIMRATDETLAAYENVDFNEVIAVMGKFNEEMINAGVMIGGEGLDPQDQGVVVDYSGDTPVVTDGPYGETKELFNGFWMLEVASKEEAVEWAKRAPMQGPGSKMEIRRVSEIDEFPQDNEWIQKERGWREQLGQK
ncbi:transcription initiation protein [Saccharomonospora sp. CUA-673]|uniref:YciI family protein n=1 Tax=Saccharomonospora sp. CUA-673 TaxID=1904969 RepID=UPI000968B664|nr:YciI family protein [Saccharomonospora sp. CUA-673]OLT46363.1 transcription initiation protein [Saccharomonospora sp. CUA-673]